MCVFVPNVKKFVTKHGHMYDSRVAKWKIKCGTFLNEQIDDPQGLVSLAALLFDTAIHNHLILLKFSTIETFLRSNESNCVWCKSICPSKQNV